MQSAVSVSIPSAHTEAGISPDRLLLLNLATTRFVALPKLSGIPPLNSFPNKFKVTKLTNPFTKSNVPFNLPVPELFSSNTDVNVDVNGAGTGPVSSGFLFKCKTCRLVALPVLNVVGMGPVN